MSFLVDFPGPDGNWHEMGEFDTHAEAVQWIRETLGHCEEDGSVCLISDISEEEEEAEEEEDAAGSDSLT